MALICSLTPKRTERVDKRVKDMSAALPWTLKHFCLGNQV